MNALRDVQRQIDEVHRTFRSRGLEQQLGTNAHVAYDINRKNFMLRVSSTGTPVIVTRDEMKSLRKYLNRILDES